MRLRDIVSIYSSGLCELVLSALGMAIAALLMFQMLSAVSGFAIDADAVLLLFWQSAIFLALWPGQTFWTIRRTTPCGFEHSIIGVPSDDDMRLKNHRQARQFRNIGRN